MDMYKVQKDVPFSVTLKILHYSLVYSYEKPHSRQIVALSWIIWVMSIINLCVITIHHLVTSIKDNIDVDTSEDIAVFAGGALGVSVIFTFRLKERNWSKLIVDITDFSKFGEPPKLPQFVRKMNMFSALSLMAYCILGIIYGIVAYTAASDCKRMNEEKGLHEFCGSFTPIRLPFESNSELVLLSVFLTQMFLSCYALFIGTQIAFLEFEISKYISIHIGQLKLQLREVFDTNDARESSKRLKFCVAYHNHIIKLIKRFNHLAKVTIGHFSLTAAIVFACIGNQIVKVQSAGSIAYFLGYVTALFYLCHAGQTIIDETASIGYALYDSRWYESDPKVTRDMILVLRRSQFPISLEALPLGDLNYALFLLILKSAYSYLTLLAKTT